MAEFLLKRFMQSIVLLVIVSIIGFVVLNLIPGGPMAQYAHDAGMTQVRLDTNRVLTAAQALYRSEGYAETPAYNDSPYAHMWFMKTL